VDFQETKNFKNVISYALFIAFLLVLLFTVPHIISSSADAVHHFILVDYITNNGYPVEDDAVTISYMDGMIDYPPFPCMIAAIFVKLTSNFLLPFDAMNFTLLLMVSFLVMLIYLITFELTSKIWASLISISFLLGNVYFYEQFLGSYFFSMIFGEVFLLLALYLLIIFENSKEMFWIYAFYSSCFLLIFSYTSWFLIPVLTFLLLAYKYKKYFNKLDILGFILILAVFAWFSYSRLNSGIYILKFEGYVPIITLKMIIYYIPLIITVIFLIIGFVAYVRKKEKLISPLIFIVVIFCNILLFYLLNFASYHIIKLVYLLTIFGTVFAGYGFVYIYEKYVNWKSENVIFIALFLLSFIIAAGYLGFYSMNASSPFTIEDHQLSQLILKDSNINKSLIRVDVNSGIENYWISLGFLHLDVMKSNAFLYGWNTTFDEEEFLLTDNYIENSTICHQVGNRYLLRLQ